jgi:hypothetical protein
LFACIAQSVLCSPSQQKHDRLSRAKKREPSAFGKQLSVFCRIEILKQHGAHSDVVFTVYERAATLAAMETFAARQADKHGNAGYRMRDLETHQVWEAWPGNRRHAAQEGAVISAG